MTAELRLQILGPPRVWRDGAELDAGPRQQAYLLALLLARAGRPIGAGELVDLIWDTGVPATAANILQKYAGAIRRLLEPDLPARRNGRYLQRRGNGYLFDADAGTLDLIAFRELTGSARASASASGSSSEEALDRYARALGLWHGNAGAGLVHGPAAMPIFAGLDGEFFDACVAAAELAVSLGRAARVLQPLSLAAWMAPLNETVQASLISALAADGRPAEALSVFESVRARLADDLGIDPGAALQAVHRRVLRSALPKQRRAHGVPPAPGSVYPASDPADSVLGYVRPDSGLDGQAVGLGGPAPERVGQLSGLVGRDEELRVLRRAVESASSGGAEVVIVEAEPGAGKTRLLEEIGAEADRRGALVGWGSCGEGDGTPPMWPWMQAAGTVLDELPDLVRAEWLGRLAPDSSARFRLHERFVAVIGAAAAHRPILLVLDDLQWAGEAALQLFGHLAARLPAGTVLAGTLRDTAPVPGPDLSRMLAAAARLTRHRRIRLGPLGPAETGELVHRETGRRPAPGAVRDIHARTAGNPFLIRELSRLLAGDGVLTADAVARAGVPATVRDIARERLAALDAGAGELLALAAVVGQDVDLALLARAAGVDVQTALDRLEPVCALGLLATGDPFSVRFPHELLREAIVRITPARSLPRLHLRVADALDDPIAARLAHHLWSAGPLADRGRTTAALVRAGSATAAHRTVRPPAGDRAPHQLPNGRDTDQRWNPALCPRRRSTTRARSADPA